MHAVARASSLERRDGDIELHLPRVMISAVLDQHHTGRRPCDELTPHALPAIIRRILVDR
jgi:hypothetical protein